jgi:uncharacterized protein YjbI with pentapeptide repeats
VEQKPKSRWRPTKNQVVRAIKVATVLNAVLIASISIWTLFERGYVRGAIGILIGILLLLTLILIRIGYRYEWTGFGETTRPKSETQEEVQPRKTLWDWLGLLIVPLVLAVGGFVFTIQQDARQAMIENQRDTRERQLEEQRAQDAALQAYLDQMSQLTLEKDLLVSEEGTAVRTLARARTRTVLAQLDGRHKGSVVQFLYEASLLEQERPVVSLSDVRLRGADLSHLNLRGADLSGADLSEARLSEADLSFASMSGVDLHGADLSKANLSNAKLSKANLLLATLRDANLTNTDLSKANLLLADLSGAKGITNEELKQLAKSLERATMPNGQKYEDWLKD